MYKEDCKLYDESLYHVLHTHTHRGDHDQSSLLELLCNIPLVLSQLEVESLTSL